MYEFAKKCLRLTKLTLLYFRRIVFVKGHFKVSPLAKIRSNLGGGFLTDQYMLYGLSDASRKKEYLSEFDWYRSRYINSPYDFLLNNKVACTQLLNPYTRVPGILAMRNKGVLSNFEEDVLEEHQVLEILRRNRDAFFKPSDKGKGSGVCRMSWDGEYRIDGEVCEEKDILEPMHRYKNWILCETIQQGAFPASLYDQTVNTMRIITFRNVETERFEVFFAVQRIGTRETIPVDNGSRGGLVACIDLETGELSEARCLHNLDVHEVHPDSGAKIKGARVPGWQKLKADVLALSRKLPYLSFIAWDIVLTDEGFAVIEANASSGVNIIQLWGGQRRGPLGDFYRHHHVRI